MNARLSPDDGDDEVLLAALNRRLFHAFRIFGRVMVDSGWPDDSTACTAHSDLPSRIVSLASMHLLLSDAPDAASFEDHCQAIGLLLVKSAAREDVAVEVDMADLPLSTRQRFRLSLLVAEMVSHVIKARLIDGLPGKVRIELRAIPCGGELLVSDGYAGAPQPLPTMVDCLAHSLLGQAFSLGGGFISVSFPILAAEARASRPRRFATAPPAFALRN